MGLRDILKKKDELAAAPSQGAAVSYPEFKLIRSDTNTHEVLQAPDFDDAPPVLAKSSPRRSLDVFRSRSGSASSQASTSSRRRLSQRLHLSKQPESSEFVPANLPDASDESQWEARATMLASQSDLVRSRPGSPDPSQSQAYNSQSIDVDIQRAIQHHEAGDLRQSTAIFGRLADPDGANNPLSQVLYGLALRHGWGCTPDPDAAVKFLTQAASNSAAIEQLALQSGVKKGGAAKGELVLAIFELANCFRHGWGIQKDAFAAKQYYETAANLGDTDAMNEAAWCYLEGFGCKKDKFAAARYYRLAEKAGSKTLGNSWIWKDKYNPPEQGNADKTR